MRKSIVFITFLLLVTVFFACDFQLPTAVHITGTPKIKVYATMDIGSLFTDILKNGIDENNTDGLEILDCPNIETQTFIIYKNIHSNNSLQIEDLGTFPGIEFLPDDFDIIMPFDKSLFASEQPIEISFSEFGELFDNLTLSAKLLIFITGTGFIDNLTLGISINGEPEKTTHLSHTSSSGFSKVGNSYLGTTVPGGGIEIPLEFDGSDMTISYRIFVAQGERIAKDDFEDGAINIDLAVWFPLVLKAGAGGGGMRFPEDTFSGDQNDLFGRDSPEDSNPVFEIFEYLKLDIGLNKNPFSGATLVIQNTDAQTMETIEITNPFTGNSLSFEITGENLTKINNSFPFAPQFSVKLEPNGSIVFPRNLKATHFAFTAGLNYRMDL
ncbi:MAG: hypothetical protein LBI28_02500 [Treponema sp.]|jgi:hypothetical protein|nr:hypothetical protein [Treponema sp.]